jgi:NTE family protein
MQVQIALFYLLSAFLLSGCSAIPTNTFRNTSVCPDPLDLKCESPSESDRRNHIVWPAKYPTPRARLSLDFRELGKEVGDDRADAIARLPPAFVGISLSGGGSRAANFALATLQELDGLGFLEHATAISSTSGGGLAGAYYALHGRNMDWVTAKEKMGHDFLGRWIAKNFNPLNILSVAFTHKDRSDLMAEVFDEVLFDNAVYGKLGAFGAGRPLFIANATLTGYNRSFRFDEKSFNDFGSRLDQYPIAQAVMASAAFPGVFNSVTLVDHQHPWTKREGPPSYVHLIDGGSSDNLGLDAIKELAGRYAYLKRSNRENGPDPACFIFVVDAFAAGNPSAYRFEPDPRGALGRFVDPNFIQAFDTLLATRRSETLRAHGLHEPDWSKFESIRTSSSVDFDGDSFTFTGVIRRISQISINAGETKPYSCLAWHINLSGIEDIPFDNSSAAKQGTTAAQIRQTLQNRVKVDLLASQTETNFRLVGPKGCAAQTLQDAIFAASSILVNSDDESREQMCKAFRDAGLATSARCSDSSTRAEPLVAAKVQFTERVKGSILTANREVRCVLDPR